MAIKITDLGPATLPLGGTEQLEIVQDGDSRRVSADDLASSAAGLDATFVTVTANPNLPNERILTAGTNVSIVDDGPGLPITINVAIPDQNPFATPLGVLGDINTATPPVAEAITALLELRDLADVNIIGSLGYNGDNHLVMQNEMRGGDIRLQMRDASGNQFFAFISDPDGAFNLRHGATDQTCIISVGTALGGIFVPNAVTGSGLNGRVRTPPDHAAVEIEWEFDTSTDMGTAPDLQDLRMNNVNPASVTEIAVNQSDVAGQVFDLFWGAELVSGDKIFIIQPNSQDNWIQLELTGVPVDQGVYWTIPVSVISNGTIFDSGRLCRAYFSLVSLGQGGGGVADPLIIGSINLTSALSVSSTGSPYDNVPLNIGANLTGTMPMTQMSRQNIQTKPSAFGFNATLFININGSGTSGSDTIIGGLNSAQLEVAFGVAVRMQHGLSSAVVAETNSPSAGGFLVNNTLTGGGLERVLTIGDLGGGGGDVSKVGTPVNDQLGVWTGDGTLEGDPDLTWDGNWLVLTNFPSGVRIEDGGALRLLADGAPDNASFQVDINSDLVTTFSAGVTVWLISGGRDIRIGDSTFADYFQMQHDGTFINFSAINTTGLKINDIPLYLEERTAVAADATNYGQLWVRDDAFDQSLRFRTASGLDFSIAAINESDVNDNTILVAGVSFVEILVSQPKQNQKYVYQASLQVSSPAADDIAIEMVIDTLATFSGMVSWTGGGGSGQERLHSAIGEVITNIVNISTDGSVSPDGTFITIVGCLINGNQSTTTMSVRVAKQLDTGADAFVYLGSGHSWRAVQSF